ncbi:hypothetical protein JQC67_12865 [Aurantibacter crassamenti]|uniref:hypothetical protein n=1 Tax=Aurantibacter crassamenti TaxID=1837375 RepID=UPI001939ED19|nr:hypothetical protein [Aurantibacter crassamenti]MBM1107036.1 hypothetical protein [Aurantibacter crassamenti]
MSKIHFFRFVAIGLLSLVLTSFLKEKKHIKYMQVATIESSAADEPTRVVSFKDSSNQEIIFLRQSNDAVPLQYYKQVKGEVCDDDACRLLDIIVYWNITGRYLGFELPKGEFLSKYDHDPFSESEYQKLHSILADESLPLDKVSFEKLLEQPENSKNVDAHSGATSKNIANMVVKGAAFTTYKLWNTVNGSTMDLVSEFTEKQVTPSLLNRILNSVDVTDKEWALQRIDKLKELTPALETRLLEFVAGDDFYLSYTAINGIITNHLKSASLQNGLFASYENANHSIQSAIIKKLKESPFLSVEVIQTSRTLLPNLNGQQLDDLLQLYTKHSVNDAKTYTAVAGILENKNKYISNKAYVFLISLELNDAKINALLNAYTK